MVDSVVLSFKMPNISTKVTCKDSLELSIISNAPFAGRVFEKYSLFFLSAGCSFSGKFFEHDHVQTYLEEAHR